MKNRFFKIGAIFIIVTMLIQMLPTVAFAADEPVVTTWNELWTAIYNASGGTADNPTIINTGAITFTNTIDISNKHIKLTGGPLTRAQGFQGPLLKVSGTSTLCLEDITLDGNKDEVTNSDNGLVQISGGKFIMESGTKLQNNVPTGVYVDSGKFVMNGGEISGNTGISGVYVNYGTFEMYGGIICGNAGDSSVSSAISTAVYAGGVYIRSGGAFTMNGGEISGNTAYRGGGGIYNDGGSFTMSGGEISGNTANSGSGGGVYLNRGSFTMNGGEISGNTAVNGGGIFNYGAFKMGSDAIITNNMQGASGSQTNNDIWLYSDKIINLTGALTSSDNSTCIFTWPEPTEGTPISFAQGDGVYTPTAGDAKKFYYNSENIKPVLADGRIQMQYSPAEVGYTVSGAVTDGTDPIEDATVIVYNEDGDDITSATTDAEGNYSVSLPNGTYYINVTADGFEEKYIDITVEDDDLTAPTIELEKILKYTDDSGNTFIYEVNPDNTLTITDSDISNTNVIIPGIIDGKAVTKIGEEAFYQKGLASVVIPEGITDIGAAAFTSVLGDDHPNKLTSVNIPASVKTIGDTAFAVQGYRDSADSGWVYYHTLETVTFTPGSQLESIGKDAFKENVLKNVTIPSNITEIGDYAFACNQLTDVTINNNAVVFGTGVFTDNQDPASGLTIHAADPSTAKTYAEDEANGHNFEALAEAGAGPVGNWSDNASAVEGTDYAVNGNTYTIKTAAGLAWLAQQVNSGNSFNGKTVELEQDLDISGHYWVPIGTASPNYYSFAGTFDGKGHKINGLYIGTSVQSPGTDGFEGLFTTIFDTAIVKNLGVESAKIYVESGGGYGGILASVNYGKITQCYTKGEITGADGAAYIGGLVASNEEGLIANSYSTADVAGGDDMAPYHPVVGGLVGRNMGNRSYGVIVNCYATGNVSVGSSATDGGNAAYAGGLVGENDSKGRIENCFATGNITGGVNAYIGGIAGFLHNGFTQVPNAKNVYWNGDAVYTLNSGALNSTDKKGAGFVLVGSDTTTAKTSLDMKAKVFADALTGNITGSTSIPNVTYYAWALDEENKNNGYPVLTERPIYANVPSSDATLTGILGQAITAGKEAGTKKTPKTAAISVANGVATVAAGDIAKHDTGATVTFYGTDATFITPEAGSVNLSAGGTTAVYIKVQAADNTMLYYAVTISRASAPSKDGPKGNHTHPAPTTPAQAANTSVEILVNGKAETAATATTTQEGGKTVTTVTVDDEKVEEKLQKEGSNAVVTIPVKTDADVVVGQLNGQTVKNMETKEAVLEIKTENVAYALPASEINIDAISAQIGKEVQLKDIKVNVQISVPSQETMKIVENTASKNNCQVVVKPVEFEITCTSGEKTVDVSKFNGYVERKIAVSDGIDPSKITTGVILNSDGTFSHVPTTVTIINGKYYAKINSLTNSTYSVIWNPKTFADAENHWAKDAINDMGSRLVISGIGDNRFEPGRDITRAEFAAIIVRALGLMRPGTGKDSFSDVSKNNWYYDAISTAYEYSIISGCGNGKFEPNDKITREQAMTMIARAMNITGLEVEFKTAEADKLLAGFVDAGKTTGYAKKSVATCVKSGIVSGRNGNMIAPEDNTTRAEVAVIVQRLLQRSGLI